MSIQAWRKTALSAYMVAGLTVAAATYTLATTQANVNALTAQKSRLEKDEAKMANEIENGVNAYGASGLTNPVDTRPNGPVDWSEIAPGVMPSVVGISAIPRPKGLGETNRAWIVPGVMQNDATALLTRFRAWCHGWAAADKERTWMPHGAGFIVADGNTVLTAGHVVAEAESVRVKMAGGGWRAARVIGYDEAQDVAVLLISGEPGPALPIASAMPRLGQSIATIGSPSGWGFSLSAGIVSRYGRDSGLIKPATFLQVDASIIGGNSGGVVFNAKGEAVGMVSYGNRRFTQTVPIERVMAVADAIRRGKKYAG